MTRLIPTEDELHAYVDERLEPARRAEVQAWLAANPQAAARVEGWRTDARRLRTALAGLGEPAGAPALELGQLRRQLRQRRQRRWAAAAAMVLA
ncbi:anti-sigma factor family protein, partial [Pseudomonas sp. UBA6699]